MKLRKLLVATAVLAFSGLSAYADTLIMNDGREIRGKLVSINRGIILFNHENGRQIRVNVNRVDDIDLGSDRALDRDNPGPYDDGRYRTDGRYSNNTDPNVDRNIEQSIAVYADRTWTDTGMAVRAGEILRFVPSGEIVWAPNLRDGPAGEVNSSYNQGRPIPDRPAGALIGRIGNDTFYIGEGSTGFRARTSGRLFLGINDDHVQDNQGHFQVVVQRQTQY